MKFTWDERKARLNERKHGVSFALGQAALDTGLGIAIEEQYREGEWRTMVVAPARGILLLTIILTLDYGDHNEGPFENEYEREPIDWQSETAVIRFISVREASPAEQELYFAYRPPLGG